MLSFLENLIGHAHPQPSYLIAKLKDYEYQIRSDLVDLFNQAQSGSQNINPQVTLPIQKLIGLNDLIYLKLNSQENKSLHDLALHGEIFDFMEIISCEIEQSLSPPNNLTNSNQVVCLFFFLTI